MQKRFLDAGFAPQDVQLLGPDPRKQNLVVRIRAAGTPTEKPVLFLCHMDVVEALRSDWTTDPFQLVEKDGFYYGRGTEDMKDGDAAHGGHFSAPASRWLQAEARSDSRAHRGRRGRQVQRRCSGWLSSIANLSTRRSSSISTPAAWSSFTGRRGGGCRGSNGERSIRTSRSRRSIAAATVPCPGRTTQSTS